MRLAIPICSLMAGLLLAATAGAEGPELITYQGVLTDADGLPIHGVHDLTFAIYADSLVGPPGLWTETHADVDIEDGLFHVILGSRTAFPGDFFASEERWLGIAVDTDPEMAPRTRLTSVPWAMRAAVADFAISGGGGEADSDWEITGENMHSGVPGNVGVGEAAPLTSLHVQRADRSLSADALYQDDLLIEDSDAVLGLYSSDGGSYGSAIALAELSDGALTNKWSIVRTTGATSQLRLRFGPDADYSANPTIAAFWQEDDSSVLRLVSTGANGSLLKLRGADDQRGALQFVDSSNDIDAEITYFHSTNPIAQSGLRFKVPGSTPMCITSSSRVGIGTLDPDTPLEVRSPSDDYRGFLGDDGYAVRGAYQSATEGWLGLSDCGAKGTHVSTGNYGRLGTSSHGVYGYAGNESAFAGYFNGKVRVRGNLDIWNDTRKILELGEGLDYAEGFNLTDPATSAPGTVLSIDPDTHGKLTVCRRAYDTRVAGIAAGARGLKSGVRLGVDGFDCDVALAGRVYCNVDAREHGIEAGDLLTTAATPGYAMKAADPRRSQGAILGKAMESLEKGQTGQILVLVTLQ
ncbi:MAG: hypothetical protein GF330_04485 [Candidatus Eisenbacteria bacterium]|nr:hypothetical protein [Candidatus Eisenbacteria bacterium]